jgi:hypothetical protein
MTLDEIKKYAEIIIPSIGPLSRIAIAGGEPTLHPQIFDVLDILMSKIRPLLEIPILFFSNGVGEKVSAVLAKMKERYSVYESEFVNRNRGTVKALNTSSYQIFLIRSKTQNYQIYIRGGGNHIPVFRASIDYMKEENILIKRCWLRDACGYGITSRGIFVCVARAPAISEVFELEPGFDHVPSLEEENTQLKNFCKYCSIPCENITKVAFSKTWENRLSALSLESLIKRVE